MLNPLLFIMLIVVSLEKFVIYSLHGKDRTLKAHVQQATAKLLIIDLKEF